MQYLLIETPEGTRRVELARDRLLVGRLAESDVALPYAQISRQHAELRKFAGAWWIRDLGSTNGLHFGSHRVQQRQLAPGDRILLAPDVALRFVDDEIAPAANSGPDSPPAIPPAARRPPRSPSPSSDETAPGAPISGASNQDPYRRTLPAQRSPIARVTLHICQTCGQRTSPDVELCYACHHSIARPCDVCHTSLLPAQERCSRCRTANPAYVGTANRRPEGLPG